MRSGVEKREGRNHEHYIFVCIHFQNLRNWEIFLRFEFNIFIITGFYKL